MLKTVLENYDKWPHELGNEEYLLRLLRADAQIRSTGALRELYQKAIKDRDQFLEENLPIDGISQIEVWISV